MSDLIGLDYSDLEIGAKYIINFDDVYGTVFKYKGEIQDGLDEYDACPEMPGFDLGSDEMIVNVKGLTLLGDLLRKDKIEDYDPDEDEVFYHYLLLVLQKDKLYLIHLEADELEFMEWLTIRYIS